MKCLKNSVETNNNDDNKKTTTDEFSCIMSQSKLRIITMTMMIFCILLIIYNILP